MKAIKYQGRIWIPTDRAVSAELPIPDLDDQAEQITELKQGRDCNLILDGKDNYISVQVSEYICELQKENQQQAEQIAELKRFEQLAMELSRCPECGTGIVGYCLGCKIKQLLADIEKVRGNGNRAIENLWETIAEKDEQIKQLKENKCCLNCMYYNTDGCTLSGLGAER